MAQVELEIFPKTGPGGSPLIYTLPNGWRMAQCSVTIPSGSVYSTTDKCVFDHANYGNVREHYGVKIIRQVIFNNGFSCAGGVSTGEAKGEWDFTTQKLSLRRIGNAGPGTGAIDDAEVTNGSTIGSGAISADALIFF